MVLIDTSAWIHALRPDGDPKVKARVAALLESGQAVTCAMIRLELWNGARGEHEKRVIRDLERTLPDLDITREVWRSAYMLAQTARKGGKSIPATDLLIAACARHHGVALAHDDTHFAAMPSIPEVTSTGDSYDPSS
ncbi:MAG: PilT protein-like [Acidobacteria bacterium]|nr:PilT protein-like [Acidobacteriota bacterium]